MPQLPFLIVLFNPHAGAVFVAEVSVPAYLKSRKNVIDGHNTRVYFEELKSTDH